MAKSKKDAQPDFGTRLLDKSMAQTGMDDPLAFLGMNPVVGAPLEAFSLQFLYGLTVAPIGKNVELVGPPESLKSGFCHEIGRWHIYGRTEYVPYDPVAHTGFYLYNLAEPGRDQPDLRASIVRLPQGHPQVMAFVDHKDLEDWQDACTNAAKTFHESTYENGKTVEKGDTPFCACVVVDSLTGMNTRAENEKMFEAGHAEADFARVAGSLNRFLKFLPGLTAGWPYSFVCTNHWKPGKDARGLPTQHVPGGFQPQFVDSLRLLLERTFTNKGFIDLGRTSGREIRITTLKNSFTSSAGQRSLVVQVTWDQKANPQVTTWQWHDATIALLTSDLGSRYKTGISKILDLEIDKTNRRVTSSTLKVKKVTWDEGGKALMQNPKVVEALQKLFMIRTCTPLLPGKTYRQCMTEERARMYAEYQANPTQYGQQTAEPVEEEGDE